MKVLYIDLVRLEKAEGQLGFNFDAPARPKEKKAPAKAPTKAPAAPAQPKPPGSGWQPIPGDTKRGGFRRRRGTGWEYWYPKIQVHPPKAPTGKAVKGASEKVTNLTPEQLRARAKDPREWGLPPGARIDDMWSPPQADPKAKWKHPDYGSGTGAAPWEKGEDWHPDFHNYDRIVVNTSAGKDSQAMLTRIVDLADREGYPREKIIVVHSDLGARVEWQGTKELAQAQADHYGLEFRMVRREKNDLVGQIEARHGDLVQKQADTATLAEAGVKSWADLTALSKEEIYSILGNGKGESQWTGEERAEKLVKAARDKLADARAGREKKLAAATAKVQKLQAQMMANHKAAKERRAAGKEPLKGQQKKLGELPGKLKEAAHEAEALRKWDPGADAVDFGKAIAWPSSDARYCTSDHKRAEIKKLHTALGEEHRAEGGEGAVRILNALGIRAQESTNRGKMDNFEREDTSSGKVVDRWYPIHRWEEGRVWDTIQRSGVPHHAAYDLGMRRMSCVFCVYATKEDLIVAAIHNPEIFKNYLELEEKVGASFKADLSLKEVFEEIERRRAAGYELNDLAEWVKKALGIDDDELAKAIVEGKPSPQLPIGTILEAGYQRISKRSKVYGVQMEWKQGGACVHLDTKDDSHHILYLKYPQAYQGSLEVAAFAQLRELPFEEHNPPAPLGEDIMHKSEPRLFIKARKKAAHSAQMGFDFTAPSEPTPKPKAAQRPPGGGWEPIMGGTKGGYRRRRGGKWQYWYPGDKAPREKLHRDDEKAVAERERYQRVIEAERERLRKEQEKRDKIAAYSKDGQKRVMDALNAGLKRYGETEDPGVHHEKGTVHAAVYGGRYGEELPKSDVEKMLRDVLGGMRKELGLTAYVREGDKGWWEITVESKDQGFHAKEPESKPEPPKPPEKTAQAAGWERMPEDTAEEINAKIEAVLEPARERMQQADETGRGLNPTESDWSTPEELAEIHRLQMKLVPFRQADREAAQKRIAERRAKRKAEQKAEPKTRVDRKYRKVGPGVYDAGDLQIRKRESGEWSIYTQGSGQEDWVETLPTLKAAKDYAAERIPKGTDPTSMVAAGRTSGKYATTGYVSGSRAELWSLRQSGELETNPALARKLVTSENVMGGKVEPESFSPEREAGVSAAAAWWKYNFLKSVQSRPPNTPEARELFTESIMLLQKGLERCRTVSDIQDLVQEWGDEARGYTRGVTMSPQEIEDRGWGILRERNPNFEHRDELNELSKRLQAEATARWEKKEKALAREGKISRRSPAYREAQMAYYRDISDAQTRAGREFREKYKIDEWEARNRKVREEVRAELGVLKMKPLDGGGILFDKNADPQQRQKAIQRFEVLGKRFQGLFGVSVVERYGGPTIKHARGQGYRKAATESRRLEKLEDDGQLDEAWKWTGPKVAGEKRRTGGETERKKRTNYHTILAQARLGAVSRKGPPITSNEGISSTGMKTDLGLHEVEYGNWTSEDEAQFHTEASHAALCDLADTLGIARTDIALNGRLTVALGSRGHGKASAHYEPTTRVINITKLRGKGSLAHEWGHFMDDIITSVYKVPTKGTSKELMATDVVALGGDAQLEHVPKATKDALKDVMHAIMYDGERGDRSATQSAKDEIATAKREMYDIPWREKEKREEKRQQINAMVREFNRQMNRKGMVHRVSEYHAAAMDMGDYWSRPHEMFARCWESFVSDRLSSQGRENTYLVDGAAHNPRHPGYYPKGSHREAINKAMAKLVEAVRADKLMEKASAWLDSLLKGERLFIA